MKHLEQLGAWPARIAWLVTALVSGGTLGDALDDRSAPVVAAVAIGLSVAWTAGAVALLVPRSASLTALRTIVPGGLAAMLAATMAGGEPNLADVVSVAVAAVATVAVLVPWVGEAWADGSSYGTEQRLLLRPPVLFTALLVPVTWVVVVAGATVGPLLLAAGRWLPGVAGTAVGFAAAALGVRSLHVLSKRWIVLVPSGLVVHDPLTMPEPQLVLRHSIRRLGPAAAGSDAHDLTAGAPGLALQLDLDEPLDLLVRTGGRRTEVLQASSVLVTPSRPRRLLDAAAGRRIPVS